jgi:AraC-like DNA-binding protein
MQPLAISLSLPVFTTGAAIPMPSRIRRNATRYQSGDRLRAGKSYTATPSVRLYRGGPSDQPATAEKLSATETPPPIGFRRREALRPSTLTDELREYLQTAVTQQRCNAESVALLTQMSRRTLNRQLRAEGTSFKQLTNETKFRVAKQLLADPNMSLGQISAVLQFSEPAAFTHAFRRWSGTTPSAWRLENRSKDAEPQREDPQPDPPGPKPVH